MNRFLSSGGLRLIVLFLVLGVSCSGCVTASLATIGTVLGAVGSAASTGADVYHLGKLDTVLMCDAKACHRAVLNTAIELGFFVKIDSLSNQSGVVYEMTLLDDMKSPVGIHIEQRTAAMTRCRVDVGFFGSEPTAKLVMERIRLHLHQPAATNP